MSRLLVKSKLPLARPVPRGWSLKFKVFSSAATAAPWENNTRFVANLRPKILPFPRSGKAVLHREKLFDHIISKNFITNDISSGTQLVLSPASVNPNS